MFRPPVLAIVLALVVGQNVVPLCRVWCGPQGAVETPCHPDDSMPTSTGAVANFTCDMATLSGAGFLRQEPSQIGSSQDFHHAVLGSAAELTAPTGTNRPGSGRRPNLAPGQRPLPRILRL